MKIAEYLHETHILPRLSATDKEGVLSEFSAHVAGRFPGLTRDMIYRELLEREKLGSTGLEDGIAIPHAEIRGLTRIIMAFGRTPGVDFQSLDSKPATLIFLLLVPQGASGIHVDALSQITRLLKKDGFRSALQEGSTPAAIYRAIQYYDGTM